MELWCKSKRWINTATLSASALESSCSFSARVDGQMLDVLPVR